MEAEDEDAIVTLGIAVPVDPSKKTEYHLLHSKLLSSDFSEITRTTSVDFCNLPYCFDPNLGLMGQLPSSNVEYEVSTLNAWNIEPHFLDTLPLSTTISSESSILIFGGLNPSSVLKKDPPDFGIQDFVLGGYSLLKREHGEMLAVSSTDRLNLSNRQWNRCASMVRARASHSVISHNGCLYAFGGRDSLGNILSSVEIYYPEQDMWSEITSLPQPCMGLSATCIKDTIWLVGGITYGSSSNPSKCLLSTVYSFIPQKNRWCLMEPLPYGCAFSSVISDCDSLWLIGGCTSENSTVDTLISCSAILQLTLCERLSKWKEVTSLLYPRHALTAILFDECIYVLAGIESHKNYANDKMEIINITTNVHIECSNIPAALAGCTSILIHGETSNYICMKCSKSHIQASSTSDLPQTENYLSSVKKDDYTSETYGISDTLENVYPGMIVHKCMSPISKGHLKAEDCKEALFDKTKVEDVICNKNIKETIIDQEYFNQEDILSSHVENNIEKTENAENFKYRASVEILLNPYEIGDVNSHILRKNKSAKKWLSYFQTLSVSDEELHNEIFQSTEPELSVETKMDDRELRENCKISEVKYFKKETKIETNDNSNYISTSVRDSIPSHDKSFIYIQSNLKSQLLDTILDTKNFENNHFQESFENISTRETSEKDMLSASSHTENIAIDEESFPIILLMGGEYQGSSEKSRYVLSYDCIKNIWKYVGYMPEYRCHHCIAFLNNKIYVIGGYDSKNSKLYKNITKRILCYDICEETWYQIAEMNYSRAYHCALILKNEIYVLGGRDQSGDILDSVEVYNESINTWKECNSLPYPVFGAAASVVRDALYLFGGITYEDENEIISCNTAVFHHEDKSWSKGPNLPIPLAFCGVSSSANSVWLFGGLKEEERNIVSGKDIFHFDVYTELWRKVAELSVSRHASVTISLGTNVFVIGGHSIELKKEVLICEKIDTLKNEVLIQEPLPIAVSGRSGVVITRINKNDTEIN